VEVPVDVSVGLANVRPTLHVRWNPTARPVSGASFDVNGEPRKVVYDPRWELWDKDEMGAEYRVTVLEGPKGEYLPLGTWVLELVALINPANYGGDLSKMVEALVDKPNEDVARLGDKAFEHLTEYLADLSWHNNTRHGRVTVPSSIR
jgi:hypothetical protein